MGLAGPCNYKWLLGHRNHPCPETASFGPRSNNLHGHHVWGCTLANSSSKTIDSSRARRKGEYSYIGCWTHNSGLDILQEAILCTLCSYVSSSCVDSLSLRVCAGLCCLVFHLLHSLRFTSGLLDTNPQEDKTAAKLAG